MRRIDKNAWVLVLLLLAGVVIGGFLGELFSDVEALSWLTYGKTFGLTSPLVLDIGIVVLSLGLTVKFTVSGIIGILIAFLCYKRM